MSNLAKYTQFERAKAERQGAEQWIALIGKHGRGTDVLNLSATHSAVKLMVCGQFQEGGKNYWDSPEALNKALVAVLIEQRETLFAAAIERLRDVETEALIAAEDEIAAVNAAIAAAKAA